LCPGFCKGICVLGDSNHDYGDGDDDEDDDDVDDDGDEEGEEE
jgi:hypothetical protein